MTRPKSAAAASAGAMTTTLGKIIIAIIAATFTSTCSVTDAVPIRLHGINYSNRQGADWEPWKCKERYQVLTDLTLLQRVTDKTRVLSLTDCGGGSQVLSVAKEIGMKVWLGLWVGFEESVFEQEKDELVRMIEAGEVDETTVLGITVGSEALYREDATIDQMLLYLEQVRQIIETAQLNLPVSIVDIEPMYTAYSQLRSAVDVIYINSFPFWEAEPIETAVDYLAEKTQNLLRLQESRGKSIVIGETGWPAKGFIEGVGTASPANQQQYFIDAFCFLEEQDWEYYWFTGIDSAWREIQDPNNTIEANWGFLYANLTLKEHFQGLTFTCDHNGIEYSFDEVDWTVPTEFTASPTVFDPASCSVHRSCTGLFGMCCPTVDGDFLGCCDTSIIGSPASSPGATNPTPNGSPTNSPTAKPVGAENPAEPPTLAPILAPTVTASPPIPSVPVAALPPATPPVAETPTSSGSNSVYRKHGAFVPLVLLPFATAFIII